jgi:hypothetical protein
MMSEDKVLNGFLYRNILAWEYTCFYYEINTLPAILNREGKEGWELVSVRAVEGDPLGRCWCVMKRPCGIIPNVKLSVVKGGD